MKRCREKRGRSGVALVTVLLIVSLLMLLVISFFSTTRIEQRASRSYADAQRAKLVAQGAVAHSIALLRANIPDPAGIHESAETAPARNWTINPGRLTLFDESGTETVVPLHTGAVETPPEETTDPDVHSVDLNEPIPGKIEPPICYTLEPDGSVDDVKEPPVMRVRWVDLLKDPSKKASEDNPVVARHAFWIDDESGKINFNTALGKPGRGELASYDLQYDLGMMPPQFRSGDGDTTYSGTAAGRTWGLGKLRSVNLDVLFDDPEQLDVDDLMAHAFLRGFSRYPEAILNHVEMSEEAKMNWWHRNRYNLTFYSRSPEFNAFGRPRLMTTNIPLSLEGGPSYQLPFVYNGPEAPDTLQDLKGVLHLHSLLGTLGFTHQLRDKEEETGKKKVYVHAANIVNRAQASMLMRYFRRQFPGFDGSFVDKYGEVECAQIAIDILNMARMATTTMAGSLNGFSNDQALRSTSVLYSPHSNERPGHNPERHYWRFEPGQGKDPGRFLTRDEDSGDQTVTMIPTTPGPHIMEVRILFKPFPAKRYPPPPPPEVFYLDHPIIGGEPIRGKRWLGFRIEVEYYMQGVGPHIRLNRFPYKTDYLRMDISGDGGTFVQELGPPTVDLAKGRPDRDWNFNRRKRILSFYQSGPNAGQPVLDRNGRQKKRNVVDRPSLGSLSVRSGGKPIRPYDPKLDEDQQRYRVLIRGPWRFVGKERRWLGNVSDPKPEQNDMPRQFDEDDFLNVQLRFRGGMGVSNAGSRPRQMIPLGEGEENTLEGEANVEMFDPQPVSISWQIEDPRLSAHKDLWALMEADDNGAGTPGARNEVLGVVEEPGEDSSQKSKFRYIQRGPGKLSDQKIDRPDEYNSRSRVSSKGYWSVLPTGIQNRVPWRTIRLSPPDHTDPPGPPDWLIMDLLGSTYPMQHDQWRIHSTLPDEFSTVSYMHSTTGAINLNTRVFPDDNPFFEGQERKKPLEAVFKNLRAKSEIEYLLEGISAHQESKRFEYVGELSEVTGYLRQDSGATRFQHEELLRNMIGCLTTRSNTFGVWGVGQVVQKARTNRKWGEFEDGDVVRGEKRFFALVERYIWPGKDGVPGNAHVNGQGVWDRHAKQTQDIPKLLSGKGELGSLTDRLFQLPGSPPTRKGGGNRLSLDLQGTYPEYDGPQPVEMDRFASKTLGKVAYRESSLEDAYNPPQAVIKYRVVYFKYLDE